MSRIVRGTSALAAGVLLLGGGATSLAYWQTTQSAGVADIALARFGLALSDDAATATLNGVPVAGPGEIAFTPGDVVVVARRFDVSAAGDGLFAVADVRAGDGSAADAGGSAIDPLLIPAVVGVRLETADAGLSLVRVDATDTYDVRGEGTATLVVTIAWPAFDSARTLQRGTLSLDPSSITLRQVPAR
jgi:alternate signal-mediated exported protein